MRPSVPFVVPTLGCADACTVIQVMGERVRSAVVPTECAPEVRRQWGAGIYVTPGRLLDFRQRKEARSP